MCRSDPSENETAKNLVLREGTGEEGPTLIRRHNTEVKKKCILQHVQVVSAGKNEKLELGKEHGQSGDRGQA